MTDNLLLRDVVESDLSIFFEQQLDPEANYMAAFTAKDPTNREAFSAHWNKILADATVIVKTIVLDGQVVGHVLSYEEAGRPEVSYWIGKEYWGKGLATQALADFLARINKRRPIYARVAKDNLGSRRVLEKCGFTKIGEAQGFANARGQEIAELILELGANGGFDMTLDRSFIERNRASTERIRALAARLTDEELQHPVGEHWTVAITLAHLAFWDRRAMYVLDMTERDGKLSFPEINVPVNDVSLPLWAAIPPRQAARIAIETAEALDKRLERFPPALLEQVYAHRERWVVRALHRGEHLDEIDAALKS
jgi:RimJ/RimL family protein N-acetyltransferase